MTKELKVGITNHSILNKAHSLKYRLKKSASEKKGKEGGINERDRGRDEE